MELVRSLVTIGNYPWRRMITSWPTAWRCGKETWNFTSRKKRTSEHHSDGTVQQYSFPQVRTSYKLLTCQGRELIIEKGRNDSLSANDKSDKVMIPGAVYRSPGIYLIAVENLGKPQLGDSLMKELCDQSSPQMGSLTSKWGQKGNTARQEGRRKERGKGPGWDWVILILPRAISPVYTFISIILETTLFIQIQVRSLNRTKGWDILDIYDFYNPTCTSSVYCFLAEHDDVAVTSNQQKTRQFIQPINYSSVAHISNKTENHGPTNTSCRFMTIDSSVNMRYCNFHNITSFDSRCSYI